jgi:hypothetical protein
MSITKEEFDAAIADLKTAFVEALLPVVESVSVLVEAAKPVESEEGQEVPALSALDIAEKFNESGLPKIALQRVAEALSVETNVKSIDELLESEKAYAASLTEAITPVATETAGVVHESAAKSTTTLAEDFDSVVSRMLGK